MRIAPTCVNERQRLDELLSYHVLDTAAETSFDALTQLLAMQLDVPIVLISLVDDQRQWFKSKVGMQAESTPRDLAFCAHAILQDHLFVVEDTLSHPDFQDHPLVLGEPFIRFYAGMPLLTANGHALGTLCVIDHQRRVLSPLERQTIEVLAKQVLVQLNWHKQQRELEQMRRSVAEMTAEKEHFFAVLAKDLRQPFNELLGYTEQLSADFDNLHHTERHVLLQRLHQVAQHTFRSVDNLLQWSMLEANTVAFQPAWLELAQVLPPIQQTFQNLARSKGVQLDCSIEIGLSVYADVNMLYALMQQLLSNALQYTDAGGHITISAHRHAQQVRLGVQDSGIGMSHTQLLHVFDLAYRQQHQQQGLGLLLCRGYLQRHNGQITIESVLSQGTHVYMDFPDPPLEAAAT